MQSMNEFFAWERQSYDSIEVKRIYIDLAGDLAAGVMLSQIVYWWLPNKSGKSKLRVKKEGYDWLAKTRHDWWDECRLKPRQADRALKILRDKGLIVTKIFKWNGNPTTHIGITTHFLAALNARIEEQASSSENESHDTVNSRNGNLEFPESGKTMHFTKSDKTITENTHETKKQRGRRPPSGDRFRQDFSEGSAKGETGQAMAAEVKAEGRDRDNPRIFKDGPWGDRRRLSYEEFEYELKKHQRVTFNEINDISDKKQYYGRAKRGIKRLYKVYTEGDMTLGGCFRSWDDQLGRGEGDDDPENWKPNWIHVAGDVEILQGGFHLDGYLPEWWIEENEPHPTEMIS